MRIKIISALTALLTSLSLIGVAFSSIAKNDTVREPSKTETTTTGGLDGTSTALNILKYGDKLTQDQVMSRIKAQYLLENGGYKDTDEVVVLISVDGESLIETFNEGGTTAKTVSEYAETFSGAVQTAENLKRQNEVVSTLVRQGLITGVEYNYTTVLNAVAVNTVYGNLEAIENTAGVKAAALSDTYNRVEEQMSDATDVPLNVVDIEDTGIYKNESGYTGLGTVTAVLDSGFDMSHRVFHRDYTGKEDKLVITKSSSQSELYVKGAAESAVKLSTLNAGTTTSGLQVKDVWYSEKIPYAYDYADKNPDVFPYDSEHGTHVAGIIAGYDEVIHGIAPDTQLVLMKVFPDLDSGGKTEDIIAALEDAVKLGVDAINMSLGTSCGFSRECDDDDEKPNVAKVYDAINDSGISLITAASNSYSAGFGGEQGNTNFVTNPDSGTVGSPSTYDAALSVASISGERSRYIKTSDGKMFFYNESSDLQKIEQNKFFEEISDYLTKLGTPLKSGDNEFQYVTVSGSGDDICYSGFVSDYKAAHPGADMDDENEKKKVLAGKIVLVERGYNSFEDKAHVAASYGAIACIIYNNVDGDISMSMGNTWHIPTISVSKDDGRELAKKSMGTLYINSEYLAGPFMSDFSSWGPTPSLGIKPEITAHGGNIMSAIPGRDGDEYRYGKLSGTSMACPNLCGIVVLIRQYLKDNYGSELNAKQIKNLANQLMMSTAGIAINEENNPYSPRKQGAGLADIGRTTTTKGYITVDGSDRTKLELKDDPKRTGVYEMNFNVVNMGSGDLVYDLSLVGMTESVSTSDDKHVAETPYILGGDVKVEFVGGKGKVDGKKITVSGNAAGVDANDWNRVKVKVTYTLTAADKKYIDDRFPYGMYVEGFVKLINTDKNGVSLNAPFLAFYGDWTEAPMFDKTYYEVETTAHDPSIDDDDKVKADYYATTPYGKYFYNYMIPLGTYLYDIDASKYGEIPASEDKIAISDTLGAVDGISVVLAGLLRGAKHMNFTITDKVTGEILWSHVDHNALKSFSQGGSPLPYYDYLKLDSSALKLINNREYSFEMKGELDYGDGGAANNKRNSYSFDFTMDNEAPVLREVSYRKEYDSVAKKDRYYVDMVVYDNQYAMAITPVIFTSSSSYTFLTKNPIPVSNAVKGGDTAVSFEITDYLDDIFNDAIIPNALAFSIDDYALNSNIYLCQLPGTKGEFKFTRTGEKDSSELLVLPVAEGEMVDLIQYLYTDDETVGENRENAEYLNHLVWTSSNEDIVEVQQGLLKVKKPGRATITVTEKYEGNQAVLIINAKSASESELVAEALSSAGVKASVNEKIQSMKFSRFETKFAYSKAAQTSDIGITGDINYINATDGGEIKMYPGESIRLYEQIKPWYVADRYELIYSSGNTDKVKVSADGLVEAIAEGSSRITLVAKDKTTGETSKITASVKITVKSPFVIENRMLVAYKGTGDENHVVKIPDDEGILYIGSFAFCLYTTDKNVILEDDDYDANKVPSSNNEIKKVIIPEGVEEIQKYAFYNCSALEEVVLPSTVKYIREFAFAGDRKLAKIGESDGNGNAIEGKLDKEAIVIGAQAFRKCESLEKIDLDNIYAIGELAFEGCKSLKKVNLKNLRNTGNSAFQACENLEEVQMNEDGHTKLSKAMFANSGLKSVRIYEKTEIPAYCFANCYYLTSVGIENSLLNIGTGAFSRCVSLKDFDYADGVTIEKFDEQVFYNATGLEKFNLPEGETSIGSYCFYMDPTDKTLINRSYKLGSGILNSKLTSIVFGKTTKITSVDGSSFKGSKISSFVINAANNYYKTSDGGKLLVSKDGKTIYLAAIAANYNNLTIGSEVETIGSGAFSGTNVKSLTIKNPDAVIGDFAFEECVDLTSITLPENGRVKIGRYAFAFTAYEGTDSNNVMKFKTLSVSNLEYAQEIGEYAFRASGLDKAVITVSENNSVKEGAFYQSAIKSLLVKVGNGDGKVDLGAFYSSRYLSSVKLQRIAGTSGKIDFGNTTFADCLALTEVEFDNVTDEISLQMFYGCTSLVSVKLYGVKKIGNSAFANCAKLVEADFTKAGENDTLEEIGDGAFAGYDINKAPAMTGITLPKTLVHIGEGAFFATGLTEITIPEGVVFDSSEDSKNTDDVAMTHFNGNYVFYACTSLTTVNLPASVTRVGKYMFARCDALKTVNLENVEYIDDYAFTQTAYSLRDDESSLETIDLSNAKRVGEAAFLNCTALTGRISAGNLEEIGAYAFKETNIEDFFAYNLRIIGNSAFENITNKKFLEFAFGDKLEKVGESVFFGCKYLEKFTDRNGNAGYDAPLNLGDNAIINDGSLYIKTKNGKWQLAAVPANLVNENGKKAGELSVMDGTYRVAAFAGSGNRNFETIILPESLGYIGNYAFYYNLQGSEKPKNELTVIFMSYKAPVLENNYNSNISLGEKAKGYGMLHAFPDIFNTELCYCNFIDVLGKQDLINMVLPENETLEGYDSLPYRAYFDIANASTIDHIAMDKYTSQFIEYAKIIEEKLKNGSLALTDEKTVSEALTAMNATKQKQYCTSFGMTIEEWENYEKVVTEAKEKIRVLKLENSSDELKAIENAINALPETFDMTTLEALRDLAAKIGELTPEDRAVLNMTKYYAYTASFGDMIRNAEKEANALGTATGYKFKENKPEASAEASAALPISASAFLGLVAVVIKKRIF